MTVLQLLIQHHYFYEFAYMSTSTSETVSREKPKYVFIIVGSLSDESIEDLLSKSAAANSSMELSGGRFIVLSQLIQTKERLTNDIIQNIKQGTPIIILGHATPHTLGDLSADALSSQLINVGIPNTSQSIEIYIIGCDLTPY